MASLIGIQILCKARCKVVFDNEKCEVFYENKIILRGYKDLTTNLWTLPIINKEIAKTTPDWVMLRPQSAHMMLSHQLPIQPQPGPCLGRAQRTPIVKTAGFSYTQTTKINNVKFMNQSFCNPPIALILKAINTGFLEGAPHLDTLTVQKYLVSSPATAKGHMKRPKISIYPSDVLLSLYPNTIERMIQ
jgi:hypothetical protein